MSVEDYLQNKYSHFADNGKIIPSIFIFEEILIDDRPAIRKTVSELTGRKIFPEMLSKHDFISITCLLIGCT